MDTGTAIVGFVGVIVGQFLSRWTASSTTTRVAELARQAERERDGRVLARERLALQVEARSELYRFVRREILSGRGWEKEELRDEAYRVAGNVSAAFASPEFGEALREKFLVHVMSWMEGPRGVRPFEHHTLMKYFEAIDLELQRVIKATMVAGGLDRLELPTAPQQPPPDYPGHAEMLRKREARFGIVASTPPTLTAPAAAASLAAPDSLVSAELDTSTDDEVAVSEGETGEARRLSARPARSE